MGAIERCHCDHATRGRGVRLDQVMVWGSRARSQGRFQAGSSTTSARVLSGAAASANGTAWNGHVVATASVSTTTKTIAGTRPTARERSHGDGTAADLVPAYGTGGALVAWPPFVSPAAGFSSSISRAKVRARLRT